MIYELFDLSLFIYIVPLVTIICIYLSIIKAKKLVNPLSIVCAWWGFWMWISNFSFSRLYIPSPKTQLIVILFLVFFTLGGLVCPRNPIPTNQFKMSFKQSIYFIKFKKILDIAIVLLFFFLTPFFIRALTIFGSSGYFAGYRNQVFGEEGRASILYLNNGVELFYRSFVAAFLSVFTILSILFFFNWLIKKYLIIAFILNFMQSFMTFGRSEVYFYLFYLILGGLLFFNQPNSKKTMLMSYIKFNAKKVKKLLSFMLAFVLAFLMIFSSLRDPNKGNVFEATWYFLIDYHTAGFSILSNEIEDQTSMLNNEETYGNATFWGVEYLFSHIIRRVDKEYDSFSFKYLRHAAEYVQVSSTGRKYNAYYPMLWAFYTDGKEFAVCLISFFLGYLCTSLYFSWQYSADLFSLTYLLLMMRAIMVSMLAYQANPVFWISLFILFATHRLLKLSSKTLLSIQA